MKINLSPLLDEAIKYSTEEELIRKIGITFVETLEGHQLVRPSGITISFDDKKETIILSSAASEISPLYRVIAHTCAKDVLEALIKSNTNPNKFVSAPTAQVKSTSRIGVVTFFVINAVLIAGVCAWIFSFLGSSDFRSWYYSELVQTNAVVSTFTFLILYPAILVSSTIGAYVCLQKNACGTTIGALALKFQLPALLLTLAVQRFIVEFPLTNNLRLLLTFLFVAFVTHWFISTLQLPATTLKTIFAKHLLACISLITTTYVALATIVPIGLTFLVEGDIGFIVSEIVQNSIYDPTAIIYVLLGAALFLLPYVITYWLLKKLFIAYAESKKLVFRTNPLLSSLTGAAVLGLFFILLVLSSLTPSMGKYGESLILLAQANDSYTTLATRASSLVGHREEVRDRLYNEFASGQNYIFDQRDIGYVFDNVVLQTYAQIVLFPFTSSGGSSEYGERGSAYMLGYERAYGEAYRQSFNNTGSRPLKQVQHLSRDVLVDSGQSPFLAEVTITDSFSTFVDQDQEIVFEFSLPENAVITNLLLGPALQHQGQIAPRGAAEQVYVEQVQRNIDPALLEQVGPRQYRLRVYPIPASNELAEIRRGESIEGEIQRVQFTYLVMRDTRGIPLPIYSEAFNILSTETIYSANLDGKQVDMASNATHVSDEQTISALCTSAQRIPMNLSQTFTATLVIGDDACISDVELLAATTNQKIQIFLDTSYKNRDGKLDVLLTQLKNVPATFYANNTVELTLHGESVAESVVLSGPQDIPSQAELLFFGQSDLRAAVGTIARDTDIVVLLSGMSLPGGEWKMLSPLVNKHLIILHTPGDIPSYGPSADTWFASAASLTVSTDVMHSLRASLLRKQTPATTYMNSGEYWYLQLEQNLSITGSSSSSSVVSAPSVHNSLLQKVAVRAYITHLLKSSWSKDYVYQQAVSAGIVTPLSSYIALVNQAQQDRLNILSGDGDRYTSEARFQVTQPRVNNPLAGSGGLFLGQSSGLSLGDNTVRTFSQNSGEGTVESSYIVQLNTRAGLGAPLIIFSLLILGGMVWLIVFLIRRHNAKEDTLRRPTN